MVRKIPFRNRFVVRFLATLVAVQVAAMGASGWYFSSRAGEDAVEKAFATNESAVKSIASFLESGFRGFGQDLTLLAATPALTSFDPAKAGELIKSYVVSSLFVSGEDVVLYDNLNRPVADNRMVGGGTDTSGFPWMLNVEAVRPFVGPVVWKGDSPSKIFAVMVQNLASTSGVLKAEFSFRRFFGLLKEYKIGEKGYVLVVDEKGQILYHPQPKILHDRYDLAKLGIKDAQPALWKIAAPTEYVLDDGNRYMANFAWIPDYRVGVVSLHPMSEIDAIVAETRKGVLALMGLVLLATLLVSGVLGIRMVRPLNVLAEKMQAVKDGDLSVESGIRRPDEIGMLAEVFDLMREQIRKYTEHLQDLVDEKMKQVRDILENIDQGLFTVNLDGTINPEHSRKATAILGVPEVAGSDVMKVLHLTEESMADWRSWIDLVMQKHGTLRWEKLAKVAPVRELDLGTPDEPKFVAVGYQKVLDRNANLVRIMVLAQDITEKKRVERIVAEEKARHENEVKTILGLVNTLPEVLQDYFEDLERRLRETRRSLDELMQESVRARAEHPAGAPLAIDQEAVESIFRDLHTIKGNSATYGFEKLTHVAHEAEELLEALKPPIEVRSDVTLKGLFGKLDELEAAYGEVRETSRRLSGGDGVVLRLPEEKVERVRELADRIARNVGRPDQDELDELLRACRTVRDVPLARLADKYATVARRLADRLGKKVRVAIEPAGLEVDPHFLGRFDEALVHMIRNSLDHAFEDPGTREAAGKDPVGTLRLAVEFEGREVVLTLSDDGRGIDGDKLVRKAIEEGAITPEQAEGMSWQQKIELVFESGLSTADAISDLSGRGVGMDAVRRSILAQGGSMLLESELGKGTTIVLRMPVA